MEHFRISAAAASVLVMTLVSCGPAPNQPPEHSGGVPILNRNGEFVGTADPEQMSEVGPPGTSAEVCNDGELVGHFEPDGFVPLEEPAD